MEVYMDNSATTRPYDEAIDAMVDVMKNYYGNPSSAHILGIRAEQRLDECRKIIANALNCSKDEIVFTSGGSESNNLFIRGFAKPGLHMITTKIEHPSVINTFKELENEGVKVTYLNVNEKGKIDIDELSSAINKDTQLVSIMHVNNEIGTVQDIKSIGKIIKDKSSRAKFHVDAVQSFGKLNIDVQECKIDLLSASGHKIHGPRGIGIAFIKKGLNPRPLITGGGQERNVRSGTENLAAIAGMAAASKIINGHIDENYKRVSQVKDYFIEKLSTIENIKINSKGQEDYSPYILNVSFIGVKGEVLLHCLEEKGVFVSTGSACSARHSKESHVLTAIGLKPKEIEGTIRFSFSEYNSTEEVDYTMESLKKCLNILRRIKK